MKIKIFILSVVFFLIFSAKISCAEVTLSSSDLAYYEKQNSSFCEILESYFDSQAPGYHSNERKTALCLIDAITHYPAPHNECLKDMFLNRYKKVLDSIKNTEVESGIVLWNIYNMSYIVKSPDLTVAFDLIRLPVYLQKNGDKEIVDLLTKELVDCCDILFVSHEHSDHADSFVATEFFSQGKLVIANSSTFKNEKFMNITQIPINGKEHKLLVAGVNIKVRIYPGHQAVSSITAVANNFSVVTFPSGATVAHSGDQYWADDSVWIDSMYKDVKTDVLLINSWTRCPDEVFSGLKPEVILPGHSNEMGHDISSRISFWQSYDFWKNMNDRVVHLFWGESYRYESAVFAPVSSPHKEFKN